MSVRMETIHNVPLEIILLNVTPTLKGKFVINRLNKNTGSISCYKKKISWFEFETRRVEGVAGKFDYPVWKKVEGPLEVFLEVFQDIMLRFVQHKSFYWHQNKEAKKLIKPDNFFLHHDAIASFVDYSMNPKKYSGRTLSQVQYQQLPEISLLNIITYSSEEQKTIKETRTHKKNNKRDFSR